MAPCRPAATLHSLVLLVGVLLALHTAPCSSVRPAPESVDVPDHDLDSSEEQVVSPGVRSLNNVVRAQSSRSPEELFNLRRHEPDPEIRQELSEALWRALQRGRRERHQDEEEVALAESTDTQSESTDTQHTQHLTEAADDEEQSESTDTQHTQHLTKAADDEEQSESTDTQHTQHLTEAADDEEQSESTDTQHTQHLTEAADDEEQSESTDTQHTQHLTEAADDEEQSESTDAQHLTNESAELEPATEEEEQSESTDTEDLAITSVEPGATEEVVKDAADEKDEVPDADDVMKGLSEHYDRIEGLLSKAEATAKAAKDASETWFNEPPEEIKASAQNAVKVVRKVAEDLGRRNKLVHNEIEMPIKKELESHSDAKTS